MEEYRNAVLPLADRVAIVFGAGCVGEGWGNGNATAVAYARAGAAVGCVDLILERADQTRAMIEREGGRAIARQADVALANDVSAAVDATLATFGQIHILHNNVGITPFGR